MGEALIPSLASPYSYYSAPINFSDKKNRRNSSLHESDDEHDKDLRTSIIPSAISGVKSLFSSNQDQGGSCWLFVEPW